jgi:hypothetical protein
MTNGTDELRFLPNSQVVAIDNNKEELDLVIEGLLALGLPAIPVLYDTMEGMKVPQIWEPARIRVIFLDLNLSDIENPGGSIGFIAAHIRDVLLELSPKGPFIIGFWTKYPTLVKKVMSHIAGSEENHNVPLPMIYVIIDKEPFLPVQGEHDPNNLREAIASALNESKVFLALMAWEAEIEKAAASTIGKINDLVKRKQPNGTSLIESDIVDVLKNIAREAWGKERAKTNPGGAVNSGLAPLLADYVDAIVGDEVYSNLWRSAITGSWNRDLPDMVSPAELNSHCLVDLSCCIPDSRGNWLEFKKEAYKQSDLWEKLFGKTSDELIEEFINPETSKNSKEIRDQVKLGLLECTAACDFINDKAPLLRYILCATVPVEHEKFIFWEPDREQKHDAIYKIEKISIEKKEYFLCLDFKYVISLPPSNDLLNLTQVAFRVRKQVLHDIACRYANYTTRPGIYSFRSKSSRAKKDKDQ